MILRWLFSKTVRDAVAMRQHVQRLLHAQRDLLSPQAVGAVTLAINELRTATREGASMGRIRIKTEELQFAANKWLKPYPNPVWRENVEVLLVAIAVAMGIRTLFLQPFKIPTGSMQPTLYGVTSTPDFTRVNFFADNEAKLRAEYARQVNLEKSLVIPPFWERVKRWFQGISYIHVVAKADGVIDRISPMQHFLIFNIKQTIWIGGVPHTIWFPPDLGESPARYLTPLAVRAGFELDPDRVYHKGEDVVKMRVHAG
ncbi:MAG: S26 family signal peptidase, partial [Verrucomicrobia bacterium]|nr:S26 family signal peptidase [Verrucomicrobiota bacterium]